MITQAAAEPSLLTTAIPAVISVVGVIASGSLLKVFFDRKLTKVQSMKTAVEGEVAQSADYRAWAAEWRSMANEARDAMAKAETSTREALAKADACEREAANLREELTDMKAALKRKDDQWEELLRMVRTCSGGQICPVVQSVSPS